MIPSEPTYTWNKEPVPKDKEIHVSTRFYFEVDEIDADLRTFRIDDFVFTFSGMITSQRNISFMSMMTYSSGLIQEQDAWPQKFENGSFKWMDSERYTAFRPYYMGLGPLKGRIIQEGQYPLDRYSICFVFGLSQKATMKEIRTSMTLPAIIQREWRVTQEFVSLDDKDVNNTFAYIGFDPKEDYVSRTIRRYDNFYKYELEFARQHIAVLRDILALWFTSLSLLGLLAFASWKIEALDVGDALTLIIGVSMSTLAFIVSVRQFLPSRASFVEIIFYVDVLYSIFLGIFIVWKVKEKSKKRPRFRSEVEL